MEPTILPTKKDPIKFSQEEISELSKIKEDLTDVILSLGQIKLHREELDHEERLLLERYSGIKSTEQTLLKKFIEKYGEGTFDQNTGIFTPRK